MFHHRHFEVGDKVSYEPTPGKAEYGEITSIRGDYIFVRFEGDFHAKACRADQLAFDGSVPQQ